MAADDFARRLRDEIRRWEADGVITADQADSIRARYPAEPADSPDAVGGSAIGNRVVSIIAIMGAVLIGLGIIAFIAANWSEIPKMAKLALMVVGTPALYAIGYFTAYRFGYPRIGLAVLLLGAIAFGASIHLVAQTYHVPVNHPNLVPFWFLGVIPLAYITRSRSMMGLSIILFVAAAGFRSQQWLPELIETELSLTIPAALVLGIFLFSAGRLHSRFGYTVPFARLLDISGLLLVAVAIYVLSFNFLWEQLDGEDISFAFLSLEYWLVIAVAGVAVAAFLAASAWRKLGESLEQVWWEAGAVAAMAIVAVLMWAGLASGIAWLWWVSNLIMLAGVLGMIAAGYRWNRAWLINLAVPIFAIALFTRYFEFGFGLLGQSVAFIVAGVILLGGGFGLEFMRRRLVQRIRQAESGS